MYTGKSIKMISEQYSADFQWGQLKYTNTHILFEKYLDNCVSKSISQALNWSVLNTS